MNVGRIKLLLWVGVLGLAGYLGWDVYRFVTEVKPELRQVVSQDVQRRYLEVEVPETEHRRLVPYRRVQSTFFDLNWTGRKPPAPVATTPTETENAPEPRTPVSELLAIRLIAYDADGEEPDESLAAVLLRYGRKQNANLRVGDHLPGKHSHVYVSEIRPEWVEFSFETPEGEEPREPERLSPPPYRADGESIRIPLVGEDGELIEPVRETSILVSAERQRFSPEHSREVRRNQWQVGTLDAAEFGENWSKILSHEVRTERHRDPSTGRYAGIRVTRVAPGSLVASHGLQPGDVVKSVNGEPVTSTQEAIRYVKTNAETTRDWVVVVERQGRDVTMTYTYDPPSN